MRLATLASSAIVTAAFGIALCWCRPAYSATYAVVVGCGYSSSPDVGPPLKYSVNDAARFADCLRACGADVTSLKDAGSGVADKSAILNAIDAVASRTKVEDVLWFYFSGHGIMSRGRPGHEQYLIPGGATGRSDSAYIDITDLRAIFGDKARCPSRHCYLVYDACFSGVEQTKSGSSPVSRNYDGVCTMAAASSDRQAWESSDADIQGGIFTHYLCLGLAGAACANGETRVTLAELRDYVCNHVDTTCRHNGLTPQVPVFPLTSSEDQAVIATRNDTLMANLGASRRDSVSHLVDRPTIPSGVVVTASPDSGVMGQSAIDYIKSHLTDRGVVLITGPPAQAFASRVEGKALSAAEAAELERIHGRFLVRIHVHDGLHTAEPSPGITDTVGWIRIECEVIDAYCAERATTPIEVQARPGFDHDRVADQTLKKASDLTMESLMKLLPGASEQN